MIDAPHQGIRWHGAKKINCGGEHIAPGAHPGTECIGYGYSKYLRRTFSFKKNDVRMLCFSYQSLARCCSVNH
jgi:hypothetical protein